MYFHFILHKEIKKSSSAIICKIAALYPTHNIFFILESQLSADMYIFICLKCQAFSSSESWFKIDLQICTERTDEKRVNKSVLK